MASQRGDDIVQGMGAGSAGNAGGAGKAGGGCPRRGTEEARICFWQPTGR
ncbi:hypothetical protein OI25_7462 [Paraburkholderia fungorum]|uniref:Uncharacterized protein n=1 Tax=Paraburkholderia fungorum TaxID=134537 RepID=A0AAU8SV34_9BURK|nr:hypothetical protein OI25_7462 [Paraburkholderia fungorum]